MFGQERKTLITHGVVVFILDKDNRVFTLQEMENDNATGKVPGEYGPICEKRNDIQESWAANMWRAIGKETRIPDDMINQVITFPYSEPERIWGTEFTKSSWATVIILRCDNAHLFMKVVEENKLPEENHVKDEVRPIGFKTREEFEALDLRSGVRNIMNKFGDDIFGPKK